MFMFKFCRYLTGSKRYRATVKLGIQTTTLDLDPTGSIVEEKPFDHVTWEKIQGIVPQFTGTIKQIPPIFSALKKDGKRLYELGRKGQVAEDVQIEAREVTIHDLKIIDKDDKTDLSSFEIDVECGGGTYIRSLIRDMGIALGTVATMSKLERTKQGQFTLDDPQCLPKDEWNPDSITTSIEYCQKNLLSKSSAEIDK